VRDAGFSIRSLPGTMGKGLLHGALERLTRGIQHLTSLLLAVMTGLITWQVFARYALNRPPSWTEEIALYMMVWLGLLGASLGVREGIHIGVEMFVARLPREAQQAIERLVHLTIGAFGFHLIWEGIALCALAWEQTSPATGIPVGWVYTVLPLSGLLILLYSVERLAGAAPSPFAG